VLCIGLFSFSFYNFFKLMQPSNSDISSSTKTFIPVNFPDPDLRFADISCGYDYSVLLSTDGQVFTTGSNFHGQLGLEEGIPLGAKYYDVGTMKKRFQRAKVDGAFQIASGWAHTLCLSRHGLLACGQNRDNSLGLQALVENDDLTYFMQVPIPGLLKYV
jgi:alpha-tubulin suppressor-like RCC1 family protein